MPNIKQREDIITKLSNSISSDVGNIPENELENITSTFDKTLASALNSFNSSVFDDNGFIKKMKDIDLGDTADNNVMKNVLNNVRSDYLSIESFNQNELLLRRDIYNICTQMPEMHDIIYTMRDAIIECNVSTGEVSRAVSFENCNNTEVYEAEVREIESKHELLMAIKNFIVPRTLMHGEMYIHVVPYAKLFAELELIHDNRIDGRINNTNMNTAFKESIPNSVQNEYTHDIKTLYSQENVKLLVETASMMTKVDAYDNANIDDSRKYKNRDDINKNGISSILQNIEICNGTSVMLSEHGVDAFKDILIKEYKESGNYNRKKNTKENHFMESQISALNKINIGMFSSIDQDDINFKHYNDIKGCYIKYLDSLRVVPIRLDRKIIGYYYATTTMDLQTNPANPNGIIDLSYQHYTRDRNMVEQLANIIIKSFNKKILEKNIKLKNEIADIIMAHKFAEGKLSFIYIPENEIIRIAINEDENGRGHSILEPSIFPARMYLMLTLYNMLYTLNNNTVRVHYLKSSGLDKNYASQIQRTIRKFQSRRITIDDIYSYSGVLNKVGGMGEMVLPAGRSDYKAIETDTIPAVENPIDMEFLERQRRQAISGTGNPNMMIVNSLDEVDFAKTLEVANARFLSAVSSYKIDINKTVTKLYQLLLKYSTDIDDDIINSFRFQFNTIKQQELNITAEMITNFNSLVEVVSSIYYDKDEIEDDKGNPTPKQKYLRKELAKRYLPQLDFDTLDEAVKEVDLVANKDILQDKVNKVSITDEDLNEVEEK